MAHLSANGAQCEKKKRCQQILWVSARRDVGEALTRSARLIQQKITSVCELKSALTQVRNPFELEN